VVIDVRLGKGQGFAHAAGQPLPERVIPALNLGGLATCFADGLVRLGTEDFLVSIPESVEAAAGALGEL